MKFLKNAFLISCLALAACSENKSETVLSFYLPPVKSADLIPQIAVVNRAVPSLVSEVDCFVVNVMGEGIGDWSVHQEKVATGTDSYIGKISQLIDPRVGGNVEIRVPTDKERVVELLGVVTRGGCGTVSVSDLSSGESIPALFRISRKTVAASQYEVDLTYGTNLPTPLQDARWDQRVAPQYQTLRPTGGTVTAIPTKIYVPFSREITSPGSGKFTSTNDCSTSPTVTSAVDGKEFVITIDGGNCVAGQSFSFTLDTDGMKGMNNTSVTQGTVTQTYTVAGSQVGVLTISGSGTLSSTTVAGTATTTTLTVTNSGSAAATLGTVSSGGLGLANPFSLTGGTCSTGQVLAVSGTCTLIISFDPSSVADFSDAVVLSYNDSSASQTASKNLTASCVGPFLTLSPSGVVNFGSVTVGSSATQDITVTNSSSGAAVLGTVTTAGLGLAGYFSLSGAGTTCSSGQSLAASQSCVLRISYAPSAQGTDTDSVDLSYTVSGITDTTSKSLAATALVGGGGGGGGGPILTDAVGTTHDFGTLNVSQTGTVTITFVNTGSGIATLQGTQVTSTYSSEFTTGTNTCTIGLVMGPGDTCTIDVEWTPTVAGETLTSSHYLTVIFEDSTNAVLTGQSSGFSGTSQ